MSASLQNFNLFELPLQAISVFQTFISNHDIISLFAYGIFGILVFWGIALLKKILAMRREVNDDPIKEAKAAAEAQDPELAGALFEEAEDYERAIHYYKEAMAFQEVGRVYEGLSQWADAAQFYKLSGNMEKAAVMYQRGREFVHAAESYVRCDKNLEAAEMYEKGGDFQKGALLYEKIGDLLKAARLYKRCENFEKAAQKYECYFLKQKLEKKKSSSEKWKGIRHTAFESGSLYFGIGQFQKAMFIFSEADIPLQAAEAAVEAGELEKAAQFYFSGGAHHKAARMYEKMGDLKQAHWVMAKKYQNDADLLSAAKAFERGENWTEAAEMYEKSGEIGAAARMFHQAGNYHRASELFISVNEGPAAAESLEKGGRWREAAELYVQLKRFEKAARLQAENGYHYAAALLVKKQGKLDRCISYLQAVGSESDDYYAASLLLGEILTEQGKISLAKNCYLKVTSQEVVSMENIEIYYSLARLYGLEKEFEAAERLFEAILKKEYSYKDVKERRDLLRNAIHEKKKGRLTPVIQASKRAPISHNGDIGRYTMIRKIGEGGMGVVFLAEDVVLKRNVAYKVLPQSIRENPAALQSFLQEARIAAALNHPNLVTIFDTGKNGEDIYITMEYVDGQSLKSFLERNKPPIEVLMEIMKSICLGVAYAHERNVIHRDLKPGNIMLLHDRTVKIMDFGLARLLTDTIIEKTSVKGTPLYMSPEQIIGKKVDKQSDIYSLGCLFYRMLAGHPPFTKGDIYFNHLHTMPSPPTSSRLKIPDALSQIILKSIEKRKEDRITEIEEILESLTQLCPETASLPRAVRTSNG
ncbi:MAG: protein kinase [Nitrospiria bacterium]